MGFSAWLCASPKMARKGSNQLNRQRSHRTTIGLKIDINSLGMRFLQRANINGRWQLQIQMQHAEGKGRHSNLRPARNRLPDEQPNRRRNMDLGSSTQIVQYRSAPQPLVSYCFGLGREWCTLLGSNQ